MVLIENNNAGIADTNALGVHNFKLIIIIDFYGDDIPIPSIIFLLQKCPQIKCSCVSYFPDAKFYAERQVLSP